MSDVDFHEALRVLQVTLDTDPKEVRRAYLRLLKKTSPERDPEGFMRLRAAYETLREEQLWRQAVQTGETDIPSASTPNVPDTSPPDGTEAQPSDGSPIIELVPRAVDDDAQDDVDLSAYYERLDELDEGLLVDEELTRKQASRQRLLIAREALDNHSHSAGAHQLLSEVLYQELITANPESDRRKELRKELAQVLRQGRKLCARKANPQTDAPSLADDGFLYQLLFNCPTLLKDSELQGALDHPDPRMQLMAAQAKVARGRYDEAVEVARRCMAELETQAQSDPALYSELKDVVSRLMGRGEISIGVHLGLELLELVYRNGDELRMVTTDSNWVLLDELINLAEGELAVDAEKSRTSPLTRLAAPQDYRRLLPRRYLRAIADATRGVSSDSEAWNQLQRVVDRDPEEAAELAHRLELIAPNLAELVGLALAISYGVVQHKTAADRHAERARDEHWDEQIRQTQQSKNRHAMWTLGLLAGIVVLLIAGVLTAWHFRDKKRRSGNPHQPMEELSVSRYLQVREPQVETSIAIVEGVCRWSRALYTPTKRQLCDHATTLAHAMRIANCDVVNSSRAALARALDRYGRWHSDPEVIGFPESREVFDRRVDRGVDGLCGTQKSRRRRTPDEGP